MRKRVGQWKISRRALARNYRLVFNNYSKSWNGYVANLIETGKFEDIVIGAAYDLTEAQLVALEKYEGVSAKEIRIELEDGNEISHAKTFVWNSNEQEHKPPRAYLKLIEEGLRQHGYEQNLIEKTLARFG